MLPKYWRQLQGVASSWDAAKQQANVAPKPKPKVSTLNCPQCGAADLDNDSVFCGICGKAIKSIPSELRPLVGRYNLELSWSSAQLRAMLAFEKTQDARISKIDPKTGQYYKRLAWVGVPMG
jgi:hypothetical protein